MPADHGPGGPEEPESEDGRHGDRDVLLRMVLRMVLGLLSRGLAA